MTTNISGNGSWGEYYSINVLGSLIAYCHQPKKPSLGFEWVLPPSA